MRQRILFSASLFHALNDAATVVTPMVFPLLYDSKRLISSYAQIGLLSNLGLMATLLIQFAVVRLSYRHEYRRLMAASLLGICLSLAAVPFSRSFGALLAFFLLLRLFSSFYHPIVIAWISRSQPAEALDTAMGIQSGSGNLGVLLAFLSVGYLAERFDWTTPLFVWAAFGLVLGAISCAALRGVSSRGGPPPSLHPGAWWASVRAIRAYVPGFFFGGMGWAVTIFYAPSLLNHEFGIPMSGTGLYLAIWIGLGTLFGYGYGTVSRLFGRRTVFLTSLAGASAALILIGIAPVRLLAVAGLLVFGAFLLMTYPTLHTYVGSTAAADGQTLAFSWVSNIQMVSGAVVGLAAGLLSDRFGIRAPFLLAGSLSLATFLYYAFPGAKALTPAPPRVAAGAIPDVR